MNWVTRRLPGIAVAALALSILPVSAFAATAAAPTGQGLEISPPVIPLTANPGQTVTTNIRVRNVTQGALVVNGSADDFGAKGEDGEPNILLDEKGATRYSLKYWVQGVPSFTLAPGAAQVAQITIALPANAEPGGHYGVIRFTGLPPDLQGTGVSLNASIGALILMRVNGAITDKLSLAEFSVAKAGKKGTFFESGPISLTERIKNEGSVHEQPAGNINVYGTFGNKIASLPVTSAGHNILPDSIRRFDQTLAKKSLFGYYTAKLAATYASGKKLTGSLSFWVLPWRLLLLILAALVVLYFLARAGIKRYNRYIIKQARKK